VLSMGTAYNRDDIDLTEVAAHAADAQRIYNEVGYE